MERHTPLTMKFHGRILEHLGIQMYQSPTTALAELIANAWDADAETVRLEITQQTGGNGTIVIEDDGIGMTRSECQDRFLYVGYNRREGNPDQKSPTKQRPILGRKGIGKFAGFGIASVMEVDTTSAETGERTVFTLDIDELMGTQYVGSGDKSIPVAVHEEPDEARKQRHGTKITLKRLTLKKRINLSAFRQSMARRFTLHELQAAFQVLVNNEALPPGYDATTAEFIFPRDYEEGEKPEKLLSVEAESGWGREELPNGETVEWRFIFHRDTIKEEELVGVAVYAKQKLVQAPFMFHIAKGLGGQVGLPYLSGQVEAPYLDLLPEDIVATDRQGVNWSNEHAAVLLQWGRDRLTGLLRIWRGRRQKKKLKALRGQLSAFEDRLGKLETQERTTVETALQRLIDLPHLKDDESAQLADAVLTAWEKGRLTSLIKAMSKAEDMAEPELLALLVEAGTLSNLSIAEAVRTKLETIAGLSERIRQRQLENAIRDYVAKHPWLLDPKWETFAVEQRVDKVLKQAGERAGLVGDDWKGRIDLALSAGSQLLIVEFMRPGLSLDRDHLDRLQRYADEIRVGLRAVSGLQLELAGGYIVADGLERTPTNIEMIARLGFQRILALDWQALLRQAASQWEEFLDALVARNPSDERLRRLLRGDSEDEDGR